MVKRISRRQFMAGLGVIAAKLGLSTLTGCTPSAGRAAGELEPRAYLPIITSEEGASAVIPTPTNTPSSAVLPTFTPTSTPTPTMTPTSTSTATPTPTSGTPVPPPTGSRVVHVHSSDATYWDYGDDYYGDYVDQDVVNSMVDRGVRDLTGTSSVAQAWQMLVPEYMPGKAIAIKINLNNTYACKKCITDCNEFGNAIDALIHPVNAIIHGLQQAYSNFNTSDIWLYDATKGDSPPNTAREIPNRIKDACLYAGVRFFDEKCDEKASYNSSDPTAIVTWRNPPEIATPPIVQVTDVLVNASYLIDMPIMKPHGGTKVTLSFKNHFGSIANVEPLHDWVWGTHYGGTVYNPLVDIYRNPHILGKTVLILGDGLFASRGDNLSKPAAWSTFGNAAPNSLFFATDPVAIDCVMCDFLHAECSISVKADDYLVYAAAVGLGTYERGDPWGSGYNDIEYLGVEL